MLGMLYNLTWEKLTSNTAGHYKNYSTSSKTHLKLSITSFPKVTLL